MPEHPTLANLVEHLAAEDPELRVAIIHALNQWMLEHWGFSHANRVYSTPVSTLASSMKRDANSTTSWTTAPRSR